MIIQKLKVMKLLIKLNIDAQVLCKGTITITGAGNNAAARQSDERSNNCASFINYIKLHK